MRTSGAALVLLFGVTAACGSESTPEKPSPDPLSPSTAGQPSAESSGGQTTSSGGRVASEPSPATGGTSAGGSGGHAGHAPQPATGGASRGGSSGQAGAASQPATGGASPNSGGSAATCEDQTLEFEMRCHACAPDDCGHCLCDECTAQAEACDRTEGCAEIAACVLETGCMGAACFCGPADPLRCLAGEASGPCKDVILEAPGGRTPTLDNPSAGPAGDAAVALGACTERPAGACAAECS